MVCYVVMSSKRPDRVDLLQVFTQLLLMYLTRLVNGMCVSVRVSVCVSLDFFLGKKQDFVKFCLLVVCDCIL